MGMDITINAIIGFKIDGQQFSRMKPAITEMKPAFNPDTGERLPNKEVILEDEKWYYLAPDEQEFDDFYEFGEYMQENFPTMNVIAISDWDNHTDTIYIGPNLPGSEKTNDMDFLTIHGPEQEISINDFMIFDEIKVMLENMNIKLGPAKLHIIHDISC